MEPGGERLWPEENTHSTGESLDHPSDGGRVGARDGGEWFSYLEKTLASAVAETPLLSIRGRVVHAAGTVIKAILPGAKIGELCKLENRGEPWELLAEVIGLSGEQALLTPLGELTGVCARTSVVSLGAVQTLPIGPGILGGILDGLGRRVDTPEASPFVPEAEVPIQTAPPHPMERRRIALPMPLGIRVLDGLLTCGEGQRVGIFAAAGVGKSSLLAQILRNTQADVVVLALIGERGREVREFLEEEIGSRSRERAVLVVSTSDRPAMERVRAAYVATAVAEYFRDRGKQVLFMMDSVTRFARALREIGLAAGEPPTRRGYPPSVFAALPKLVERCGQGSLGSITAIYTILVEGDDPSEPVADEMRSLLDGHILLSRKLAAASHYPAVDVLGSVSRVFSFITTAEHQRAAARLRALLAKYQEVELLVRVGEYQAGSDPLADEALAKLAAMQGFLRQRPEEEAPFEQTVAALERIAE